MNADIKMPTVLNTYLRTLRWGLSALPERDRAEIVQEIQAHFLDALEQGQPVDQILAGFGPANEYARDMVENFRLSVAAGQAASLPVAMVLFSRIARGTGSILVGAITLLLGLIGLTFAAMIPLEILQPEQTGLWLWQGRLFFGSDPSVPPEAELLGIGLIPLALSLVGLCGLTIRALLLAWGRRALR